MTWWKQKTMYIKQEDRDHGSSFYNMINVIFPFGTETQLTGFYLMGNIGP